MQRADLITFGPGSLFTSVIPNVLVQGVPEAIRRSRALKAYFVNLMWQPGEPSDFGHRTMCGHQSPRRNNLLDVAVAEHAPHYRPPGENTRPKK